MLAGGAAVHTYEVSRVGWGRINAVAVCTCSPYNCIPVKVAITCVFVSVCVCAVCVCVLMSVCVCVCVSCAHGMCKLPLWW